MSVIKHRLSFEALERRDTPAFTATLSGAEAEVVGDGAGDTFVLVGDGGLLRHNRTGDPGFASGFDWDTTVAGVQSLPAAAASRVTFADLGGGDDLLQFGQGGFPTFNIKAALVVVTGGAGADRILIGNSDNSNSLTYDVSLTGVQSTGLNLTTLTPMDGGTIIATGVEGDTVNVAGTSAPLTIDGNEGQDFVNIGRVGLLGGLVRVFNGGTDGSRTRLMIDDRENVGGGLLDFADAATGDDTVVRRGPTPVLQFDANEVENLVFFGGSGPDNLVYQATRGVVTGLLGGDGDNTFQATLPAGATGELGFGGGGGKDTFVVNRPVPADFKLTANGSGDASLDTLVVAAGATVTVTHTSSQTGTVQASPGEGVTTFSSMRKVLVSGSSLQTLIFNLPPAAADGTLRLGDDGDTNDPDGQQQVGESLLAASSATATQFTNPGVALVVNLGDGGNGISMLPMDAGYAPTGDGLEPGGTFLRGGTGADFFFVTPDADSTTTVTGGPPTAAPGDTLELNAAYPNPTATAPDGTLGSGPGSVTFTGIETLDLKFLDDKFVVGPDRGAAPQVALYDDDPDERFRLPAFPPAFTGGVRVASGDFNGDGFPDAVVGTGPGSPTRVRILDGLTDTELFTIDPFEAAFTGGVYVAAGDLTGDGVPELVISPDEGGGPRVRVFDGDGFAPQADFFGIDDPNFRGGARAAVGDIDGDGFGDLLVAAGFGGGPRVAAFKGSAAFAGGGPKLFGDFFLFEQSLRNGAFIALGDVNGDGKADIVGGGGPGGGPRVLALSGADLLANKGNQSAVLANFFGGDPAGRGGIRVLTRHLDGDTRADIVVGAGTGSARVTAYLGRTITPNGLPPVEFELDAFPGYFGGVFVG